MMMESELAAQAVQLYDHSVVNSSRCSNTSTTDLSEIPLRMTSAGRLQSQNQLPLLPLVTLSSLVSVPSAATAGEGVGVGVGVPRAPTQHRRSSFHAPRHDGNTDSRPGTHVGVDASSSVPASNGVVGGHPQRRQEGPSAMATASADMSCDSYTEKDAQNTRGGGGSRQRQEAQGHVEENGSGCLTHNLAKEADSLASSSSLRLQQQQQQQQREQAHEDRDVEGNQIIVAQLDTTENAFRLSPAHVEVLLQYYLDRRGVRMGNVVEAIHDVGLSVPGGFPMTPFFARAHDERTAKPKYYSLSTLFAPTPPSSTLNLHPAPAPAPTTTTTTGGGGSQRPSSGARANERGTPPMRHPAAAGALSSVSAVDTSGRGHGSLGETVGPDTLISPPRWLDLVATLIMVNSEIEQQLRLQRMRQQVKELKSTIQQQQQQQQNAGASLVEERGEDRRHSLSSVSDGPERVGSTGHKPQRPHPQDLSEGREATEQRPTDAAPSASPPQPGQLATPPPPRPPGHTNLTTTTRQLHFTGGTTDPRSAATAASDRHLAWDGKGHEEGHHRYEHRQQQDQQPDAAVAVTPTPTPPQPDFLALSAKAGDDDGDDAAGRGRAFSEEDARMRELLAFHAGSLRQLFTRCGARSMTVTAAAASTKELALSQQDWQRALALRQQLIEPVSATICRRDGAKPPRLPPQPILDDITRTFAALARGEEVGSGATAVVTFEAFQRELMGQIRESLGDAVELANQHHQQQQQRQRLPSVEEKPDSGAAHRRSTVPTMPYYFQSNHPLYQQPLQAPLVPPTQSRFAHLQPRYLPSPQQQQQQRGAKARPPTLAMYLAAVDADTFRKVAGTTATQYLRSVGLVQAAIMFFSQELRQNIQRLALAAPATTAGTPSDLGRGYGYGDALLPPLTPQKQQQQEAEGQRMGPLPSSAGSPLRRRSSSAAGRDGDRRASRAGSTPRYMQPIKANEDEISASVVARAKARRLIDELKKNTIPINRYECYVRVEPEEEPIVMDFLAGRKKRRQQQLRQDGAIDNDDSGSDTHSSQSSDALPHMRELLAVSDPRPLLQSLRNRSVSHPHPHSPPQQQQQQQHPPEQEHRASVRGANLSPTAAAAAGHSVAMFRLGGVFGRSLDPKAQQATFDRLSKPLCDVRVYSIARTKAPLPGQRRTQKKAREATAGAPSTVSRPAASEPPPLHPRRPDGSRPVSGSSGKATGSRPALSRSHGHSGNSASSLTDIILDMMTSVPVLDPTALNEVGCSQLLFKASSPGSGYSRASLEDTASGRSYRYDRGGIGMAARRPLHSAGSQRSGAIGTTALQHWPPRPPRSGSANMPVMDSWPPPAPVGGFAGIKRDDLKAWNGSTPSTIERERQLIDTYGPSRLPSSSSRRARRRPAGSAPQGSPTIPHRPPRTAGRGRAAARGRHPARTQQKPSVGLAGKARTPTRSREETSEKAPLPSEPVAPHHTNEKDKSSSSSSSSSDGSSDGSGSSSDGSGSSSSSRSAVDGAVREHLTPIDLSLRGKAGRKKKGGDRSRDDGRGDAAAQATPSSVDAALPIAHRRHIRANAKRERASRAERGERVKEATHASTGGRRKEGRSTSQTSASAAAAGVTKAIPTVDPIDLAAVMGMSKAVEVTDGTGNDASKSSLKLTPPPPFPEPGAYGHGGPRRRTPRTPASSSSSSSGPFSSDSSPVAAVVRRHSEDARHEPPHEVETTRSVVSVERENGDEERSPVLPSTVEAVATTQGLHGSGDSRGSSFVRQYMEAKQERRKLVTAYEARRKSSLNDTGTVEGTAATATTTTTVPTATATAAPSDPHDITEDDSYLRSAGSISRDRAGSLGSLRGGGGANPAAQQYLQQSTTKKLLPEIHHRPGSAEDVRMASEMTSPVQHVVVVPSPTHLDSDSPEKQQQAPTGSEGEEGTTNPRPPFSPSAEQPTSSNLPDARRPPLSPLMPKLHF